MKKLFLVPAPTDAIVTLILEDHLKSHVTKKSIVMHASAHIVDRIFHDTGWRCRNFAQQLAKKIDVPCLSLGQNINLDSLKSGWYDDLWRFLNESSDYYTDNIVVVLPVWIFTTLHHGKHLLDKRVSNEAMFHSVKEGDMAVIDFTDWRKDEFPIEIHRDRRLAYISVLPWQLTPSGYSSPTTSGGDTRTILDRLIVSWLGVAGKNNSWARNVRRRILSKVQRIASSLHYKSRNEKAA